MLNHGIAMVAAHAIAIFSLLPGAYSHGYMVKPSSRNDLNCAPGDYGCRSNVAVPRNYRSRATPGLGEGSVPEPACGAGKTGPEFKKGRVVATYRAGDTIEVEMQTYENHAGHYAYRLCLDGSDTEECFKKNYLQNDQGKVWMAIPKANHGMATFRDRIRIPEGINCDKCTLSWRWDTYSDQFDALGGGAPDAAAIRVNCADITITGGSGVGGDEGDSDVGGDEGDSDVGGNDTHGGNATHSSSLLSAAGPTPASSSFLLTVVVLSTVLVVTGMQI